MSAQITNYQCPACTGPLQFQAGTGTVCCEFCGSTYPVAEIEGMYAGKNAQAAQNKRQADAKREREGDWDLSGIGGAWDEEGCEMRAYECPSCGAQLICTETTAATACPYCGNPSIVPGQLSGALKPDYVIPFKVKKEDAVSALKKHYRGRPFLPRDFQQANHLEEVKGVYVPFWLFDAAAEGEMTFEAKREKKRRIGQDEVTDTEHYAVSRSGSICFEHIPVDASRSMPDDCMESLEPFHYGDLTAFSAAYMPGFLADKYDVETEECCARAESRVRQTMSQSLRDTVTGYDSVVERGRNIRIRRGEVKYGMLPVWLLSTRWNGEQYLFAMNGQTGKFVGDLPVDRKKKWGFFAGMYALTALLTLLFMLFPGGLLRLLGW